jgi:hypothetical protein
MQSRNVKEKEPDWKNEVHMKKMDKLLSRNHVRPSGHLNVRPSGHLDPKVSAYFGDFKDEIFEGHTFENVLQLRRFINRRILVLDKTIPNVITAFEAAIEAENKHKFGLHQFGEMKTFQDVCNNIRAYEAYQNNAFL